MSFTLIKQLLLILSFSLCVMGEKLICYSQSKAESEAIFKHFNGVTDGFYADISPSHPILDSSTVYIRSQGWSGVNLLTNSQNLKQFQAARPEDINIFLDAQSSISPDTVGTSDQNYEKKSFKSICSKIFYRKPQLLAISGQYFKFMLDSNDWTVEKCKPQIILIRSYQKEDAIDEKTLQILKQKQYTQSSIKGDFKIFIHAKNAKKYEQTVKSNSKMIPQSGLIPFSSVLSNLAFRATNKQLSIKQIKGNLINPQIYVGFMRNNKNFDARQVSKQIKAQNFKDQNIKNLLVMQFNPKIQRITIQAESFKTEIVNVGEGQKLYHVTYYCPKNPIQLQNIYIFDHQFTDTSESNLNVIALPPFQEQKTHFNGSSVDKYDLSKIDQLKLKGDDRTEAQQKTQKNQQQTNKKYMKQQKLLQQAKIQAQKSSQQELRKQKQMEQLRKQLQKQKKKQEQKRNTMNQNETKLQINVGNGTTKDKTLPLKKKTYTEEKPKIQNLTPESILGDQQVINKTIWILALVFSILGSIILTATVTACILKRRHKAHIRTRIKHNQENQHIEQSSEHQETEGHKEAIQSN